MFSTYQPIAQVLRMIWHRVHYPFIPTLEALRERLVSGTTGHSTSALYALLCLLATEAVPISSPVRPAQTKILRHALFHYGQAVLIKPPAHRDTVTFFQVLAEYRPLAMVNNPVAAVSSLTDSSYFTLAINAAREIELDQSWRYLDHPGPSEETLLETLQWLHLFMTHGYSSFVIGKSDMRQHWLADIHPLVEKLELIIKSGRIPTYAMTLTTNLIIAVMSARARHQLVVCWRNFDDLRAILQQHQSACDELRSTVNTASRSLEARSVEKPPVLQKLFDTELDRQRFQVEQSAMFFAVMAGSYFRDRAQFDASEVTKIGEHVIDNLKIPPGMNKVHAFMAEIGASTADKLENQLNDIVHSCDLRLNDITNAPPTKTFASETLHTAYLLVQQNAARLKGWGGLHERVDDHVALINECAKQLDAMAAQEGGTGSICKPTAALVSDLARILSEWIERLAQTSRLDSIETGTTEANPWCGPSTISRNSAELPLTTTSPSMPPTGDIAPPPGDWANDLFASWEMWPQPEDVDFSQFIDFDFDPTTNNTH